MQTEDSDGLIRCPTAGCDHPGFQAKEDVVSMQKQNIPGNTILMRKDKRIPNCLTDHYFTHSFSQWLQSSCGGGKSQKQSDILVTRALKSL